MLHPSTPTKADDGIERLKQSLFVKWGVQFPSRDSAWSPSRRDPNRVEDKILAVIQFLYFRDGALQIAVEQFEKCAGTVYSKWQFKPRGEPDMIPSREGVESTVKRDFLRKRGQLEGSAVKEVTESLWWNLSQIADRVKAGEKFPLPTIPSIEKPKAASVETTPQKMDSSRQQSSLMQWFRSKSDPSDAPATNQLPSSDDFPDEDMMNACMEVQQKLDAVPNTLIDPALFGARSSKLRRASDQTNSTEERLETPHPTPPRLRGGNVGLGIAVGENTDTFYHKKPDLVPVTNRKRSFPEPMKPPLPRKSSRETRGQRDAYNVDHLAPYIKPDFQKKHNPEPNLKVFQSGNAAYAVPTPPPDDQPLLTRSFSRNQSLENLASVSSSMTSASSAWTTPNTSFSSDSMATSFSSSTGGTDTTIRAPFDKSTDSYHAGRSAIQSEADSDEWDQFYRAQTLQPPQRDSSMSHPTTHHRPTKPIFDWMDIDSKHTSGDRANNNDTSMAPPPGPFKQMSPTRSLEEQVAGRLHSHSPFVPIPKEYIGVPLGQLYEAVRVAGWCKLPLKSFANGLKQHSQGYKDLWSSLTSVARSTGFPLPERSSSIAWAKAGENFERVSLSGRLKFTDQTNGPVFDLTLNPLKIDSSYRLARRFGHDRFCVIGIPSIGPEGLPSSLKPNNAAALVVREAIIKWLVQRAHLFLGRTWRAFFVKPEGRKTQKGIKSSPNDIRFRIYFFAEDGAGFRCEPAKGEVDPRMPNHSPMSVKELVEWFMASRNNADQPALKFFSRLALGLTSTTPAVEFFTREIVRSDDARADNPIKRRLDFQRSAEKSTNRNPQKSKAAVMNDGCARISRNAANAVAAMLGLDHTPSVFQGRIGGAKGVWMVDALDEAPSWLARKDGRVYWIEITDKQLKFAPHSIDALSPDSARVTFEVNKYSKKLTPGYLNFPLIPILEKGGVPQDIFKTLLQEDLSSRVGELEVAMDDALSLRKWNQDNNSVAGERAAFGGVEMLGGLPESRAEKINWFVESGFEPKTCLFLKNLLYKAVHSYCLNLENRMNIGLGLSTNAYIIADPLAMLEEGEIHVSFSSVFRDSKSGFDETMLHEIDVLVARLPAHLPSDIQKVRAVFKPELRAYRDVVVFSSKGEVPLASKLSGGDYDGDRVWMCWDPKIVGPFRNAPVPDPPPPDSYGIEKDLLTVSDLIPHEDYMNRFLGHAFNFNLQMNMLGICTTYHEALCYHINTICSDQAIRIAALLGNLVDSNKQGYRFDDAKWAAYLRKHRLPRKYDPPAYKDKGKARAKDGNLIDDLVFNVAKKERQEALRKFDEHFKDVESWDEDLVRIRNEEVEEAKTNKALATVLTNLKTGLDDILKYWRDHCRREDDEDEPATARRGNSISFRAIVEKCRQDFVALAPITMKSTITTAARPTTIDSHPIELSDTIHRWQRAHAAGKCSDWDVLKASVAFYHFHRTSFVWHVAGTELGQIKAGARGAGTYRTVVNELFDCCKLDGKLVEGGKRRELQQEADRAQRLEEGVGDGVSDDETDFGDAWSQVDPRDYGF